MIINTHTFQITPPQSSSGIELPPSSWHNIGIMFGDWCPYLSHWDDKLQTLAFCQINHKDARPQCRASPRPCCGQSDMPVGECEIVSPWWWQALTALHYGKITSLVDMKSIHLPSLEGCGRPSLKLDCASHQCVYKRDGSYGTRFKIIIWPLLSRGA